MSYALIDVSAARLDITGRERAEEMFLEMQQLDHNSEENRRPAPPALHR
jgi:hypothetical protein